MNENDMFASYLKLRKFKVFIRFGNQTYYQDEFGNKESENFIRTDAIYLGFRAAACGEESCREKYAPRQQANYEFGYSFGLIFRNEHSNAISKNQADYNNHPSTA